MIDTDFQADCSRCVGLCCVALAFSRSDQFGHDKVAGEPCYHLDATFRCGIHARREALGYEGCEAYDCLGAGQRATAIFATRNWQRDPSVMRQLHARFALLTRLQEMRQALAEAANLDLSAALDTDRRALLSQITALADGYDEAIEAPAADALRDARDYLRRLSAVT